MTRAYVYRITDKVTGKWYIGSNYKEGCDPEWLGTKYFTSSRFVRRMFQNDPDRFEKEILVIGDPDYVIFIETELLMSSDAMRDPMSYNGHNNSNNVNSRKVGLMTKELGIGVHGRSKEKMISDCKIAGKISCELRHRRKDHDGKSTFAKQIGKASHVIKDERGKSARMVPVGYANMIKAHAEVDDKGKSKFVMSTRCRCDVCGYENIAMIVGKHQKSTGHSGRTRTETEL